MPRLLPQAAACTVLEHTALLLSDVGHQRACLHATGGEAAISPIALEAFESASRLEQQLQGLHAEYEEVSNGLMRLCGSRLPAEVEGSGANGGLVVDSQLSTAQLDAVIKAVGHAQFALMQAMHKWVVQGLVV